MQGCATEKKMERGGPENFFRAEKVHTAFF
jgi:hypothetical protein